MAATKTIFGEWLDNLLKKNNVRRSDLADHLQVSRQAVNNWLRTGRISREHLVRIEQLFEQRSPIRPLDKILNEQLVAASIESVGHPVKSLLNVPAEVNNWSTVLERTETSTPEFALRVENNLMQPEFREGDTLHFDSSKKINNGDYVLIHAGNDPHALLARVMIVAGVRQYAVLSNNKEVMLTTDNVEIKDIAKLKGL